MEDGLSSEATSGLVDPLSPSQSAAKEFSYQPVSMPTLTPWVLQGAEDPRGRGEEKRGKGDCGGATSSKVRSGYPVVSTEFSTDAKKT